MGIIRYAGGRAVLHAQIWEGAVPLVIDAASSPACFSPGEAKAIPHPVVATTLQGG